VGRVEGESLPRCLSVEYLSEGGVAVALDDRDLEADATPGALLDDLANVGRLRCDGRLDVVTECGRGRPRNHPRGGEFGRRVVVERIAKTVFEFLDALFVQ